MLLFLFILLLFVLLTFVANFIFFYKVEKKKRIERGMDGDSGEIGGVGNLPIESLIESPIARVRLMVEVLVGFGSDLKVNNSEELGFEWCIEALSFGEKRSRCSFSRSPLNTNSTAQQRSVSMKKSQFPFVLLLFVPLIRLLLLVLLVASLPLLNLYPSVGLNGVRTVGGGGICQHCHDSRVKFLLQEAFGK